MSEEILTLEKEVEMIEELKKFDSGTITNVVAAYPGSPICLNLYDPWDVNWYTDDRLRVMYPELGPMCGFAVTCTFGLPDANVKAGPSLEDVFQAVADSPKPVVLLIKQNYPEAIKRKVAQCGGNMATAFKTLGCVAIISDGPARDVNELRGMGIQYMLTGTTAGRGPMAVKAVNEPVEICGMDVCPGQIVHVDENGAVKFPRKYLKAVLENCRKLAEDEEKKQALLSSTDDPKLMAQYMKGVFK